VDARLSAAPVFTLNHLFFHIRSPANSAQSQLFIMLFMAELLEKGNSSE
jgi:hypothetical protein